MSRKPKTVEQLAAKLIAEFGLERVKRVVEIAENLTAKPDRTTKPKTKAVAAAETKQE